MNRAMMLLAGALCALLPLFMSTAVGQTAKDLARGWGLVSIDNVRPDGSRVPAYGPNPRGFLTFDGNGRYAVQVLSNDRPRIARDNRMEGTPEENKALVQGSNSHWGTYTVNEADRTITFRIQHSFFPNWEGTEQRRPFAITGDELKYTVPDASMGGAAEVVWRRAR